MFLLKAKYDQLFKENAHLAKQLAHRHKRAVHPLLMQNEIGFAIVLNYMKAGKNLYLCSSELNRLSEYTYMLRSTY